MRRAYWGLLPFAWVPLAFAYCGGDSNGPDGGMDVTTVDVSPDVAEASVDVYVDAPPERAIWVATATTLFKFDPIPRTMTRIADFDCSGEPMIDLAMNGSEELFGITSESVVRIDKTTGVCVAIARGALDLPYATGFVAAASLEAGVETWLGYKYSTFDAIDTDAGGLTFAGFLGYKAGNFQASGDMVSMAGGGTYITGMDLDPNSGDGIIQIDPNTGAATQLLGVTGISALVGLAQWAGTLYAFSEDGAVYRITLLGDAGIDVQSLAVIYDYGDAGTPEAGPSDASTDGDAAPIEAGPKVISFRGAAVTTRAPVQ